MTALNDFAAVDQGRFSCVVAGEVLARGVSLCLVTAAQWFECAPVGEGRFRFTVGAESVRYLPVACHQSEACGDDCGGQDA